ncbi:MAG TPA: hypothetical protein VLB85_14260 [Acidimicrobiia bacterium]|nr:hypothetical protein [Acidimicrobiia bacterium]
MYKKFSMVLAAGAAFILVGCGGETPLDAAEATARFAECLDRNEVVYENLEVELDADGTVGTISVGILSEGEVAYEPAIRLACTEEVELLAADG